MNNPAVVHGTFAIERLYESSPVRVFAAWADPEIKAQWFVGPEGWTLVKRELDFRIGGSELLHGRFRHGPDTVYVARYHDIVQDERIVSVYDMRLDQKRHSVSIATVELTPLGAGTRMLFTEQVAFLDGSDGRASREQGSAALLDRLGTVLR
ncbi:MAG TPA: SRPBCC family protein [Alphaproteobacteria bacterium]|nr:SRPBCC family protein [Alphaproteobacteria bacterium]